MTGIIITLHVIVSIALIMIVLLQTGKGADMGAAFGGGGSQTLFGSTGASTFLSKATTVAAVIFMLTSFTLAYMSMHQNPKTIMEDAQTPVEQPVAPGENSTPPVNEAVPVEQPAPAATSETGSESSPSGTE